MITTKINTNYIKNMAYTFILKENITSLPINALAILRRRKYYLRPYEQFHVFNATPEQIICVFGNAFVYPTRSATTPYGLGINMKCSFLERNWSVMHELGHIELGHVTHLMSASGSYDDVVIWAEREVELFCMYVMCPDVILQELNICSLEDIQRTCLLHMIYGTLHIHTTTCLLIHGTVVLHYFLHQHLPMLYGTRVDGSRTVLTHLQHGVCLHRYSHFSR